MEVIMVYPLDPSKLEGGGGIRYVHNLIINYLDRGIKVKLLGIKLVEEQTFKHPLFELIVIQEPHKLKIPHFLPQIVKDIILISHFLFGLTIESLRIKTSDNSVIHAHRSYFLLPFILFCPKTPKVCTLHMKPLEYVKVEHQSYFKFINFIYGKIESFCLKKTDRIIAINEDVNKIYNLFYPHINDKIVTLATGVDLSNFYPLDKANLRSQYGLNQGDIIIISAGRLEKIKNIDFLIRAFKILNAQIPRSKLLIVGSGSQKNKLENQANQLELSNNVVFYGEVPPLDVPKILNCGDILALTSISEASPNIVKEALACGIPVVSTDVGDVSSIITNDFLGQIAPRDECAFAQCLIDTLKTVHEQQSTVKNKCLSKSKEFDMSMIIAKMIQIYSMS
ncbi:Glycosyltransferase [Methanosarcina siciliae HI350]|uniref:Glycosyltransferase n=1 Tax=Methanosarcina siciliae HI350 TaxID=1434119 RepID=A0A0E3LB32_9EURY|nr:glycosyltransferase family 4 protein [Methanosarcina siciliae]AKB33066.1 Glycosyltransferase [Methanosarcina siciliae HI350]